VETITHKQAIHKTGKGYETHINKHMNETHTMFGCNTKYIYIYIYIYIYVYTSTIYPPAPPCEGPSGCEAY
jgi:hypothetical protein